MFSLQKIQRRESVNIQGTKEQQFEAFNQPAENAGFILKEKKADVFNMDLKQTKTRDEQKVQRREFKKLTAKIHRCITNKLLQKRKTNLLEFLENSASQLCGKFVRKFTIRACIDFDRVLL